MKRVTKAAVQPWLEWAKDYGEIESFELSEDQKKWSIKLREGVTTSGLPAMLGYETAAIELELAHREALMLGYGLAAAGSSSTRPRMPT